MLKQPEKERVWGLMMADENVRRHILGGGSIAQVERTQQLEQRARVMLSSNDAVKGLDWIKSPEKKRRDKRKALALLILGSPLLVGAAGVVALKDWHNPLYYRRTTPIDEFPIPETIKIATMNNGKGRAEQAEINRFLETGIPQCVIRENDPHERRTRTGKVIAELKIDDSLGLISVVFGQLRLTGPRVGSVSDRLAGVLAAENGMKYFQTYGELVKAGLPFAAVGITEVINDHVTLIEATILNLVYAELASKSGDDKILGQAALKILKKLFRKK